ncbi:MAG: T9SS type A sorting domain-containing protein [Flavobacteriales bacterium]|jgi:hypothetical protein|nr:T9SS type A sorting domain-containing protein [Flavobacteriales bacterium]
MRTFLTPLAGLLLLPLSAQHTIGQSDLSPFGVQTDMHLLSAPATLPALSDGNNQTWDLSSITLQAVGTLNFTPASGTPYAATYPTANWAWAQIITGVGANYTYLDISATGINILARDVPSDPDNYTDPVQVMKFPLALGEAYTDSYSHSTGSSTATWTYTGAGTLITPLGTFMNVAKVQNNEGDLLLWNTAPLYPILIDDGDNVLVFAQNNVGVSEHQRSPVGTYPNPCRDRLTVDGAVAGSSWRIVDTQGRTLGIGTVGVTGDQQVDVSGLAPGSHVLVLNDHARFHCVRFMKE